VGTSFLPLQSLRFQRPFSAISAVKAFTAEAPEDSPSSLRKAESPPAGKLHSRETIVKGIERAPEAFIGLFSGKNMGKMVVEVGA